MKTQEKQELQLDTRNVFLAKLELCRRMVGGPTSFEALGDLGPFGRRELSELLHKLRRHMCLGNIDRYGITVLAQWAKELGWELVRHEYSYVGDDEEDLLFGLRDEKSGVWVVFHDEDIATVSEFGSYSTLNNVLSALATSAELDTLSG